MPVKLNEQREHIVTFLKHHNVGVLATVNHDAIPHAATIYFVTDDDLDFFFVTKEETTKYKNLQRNSHAALAVYDASTLTTLQISGRAEEVHDMDLFMDVFDKITDLSATTSKSDRTPVSKLFAGDYFMYKLHPKTIRLAEYTKPDHGDLQGLFEVVTPDKSH